MNYKRNGAGWNPVARFTMHRPDGFAADNAPAFSSRSEARRALAGRPDGYWLKDNINTYFIYEVRRGQVVRSRVPA